MVDEVLLHFVQTTDVLRIFIVCGSYFLCWFVLLQLGYYFLTNRINDIEIAVIAFIGMLFSFFSRIVITNPIYLILTMVLYMALLKIVTKERSTYVFLATSFVYFILSISVFFFGNSLVLMNEHFRPFLRSTFGGVITGTLIETSLPALVLFLCWKYKLQLAPDKMSMRRNIWKIILFICLIYYLYSTLVIFWNQTERLEGILDNQLYLNMTVASMAFVSFFAHNSALKTIVNNIKQEHQKQAEELQQQTAAMALNYETKIDHSFSRFCQQTTDTMRNCLLNVSEALKEKPDEVPRLYHKLVDISSAEAGENPILKYILMTKRLSEFSSGTRFFVYGAKDLSNYYDMDFWILVTKILDIIGKAHHDLDRLTTHHCQEVIPFSAIYLSFNQYPGEITLAVDTNWRPDTNYHGWRFMEHHLNPSDKDVYQRLLHSDEKSFSYGVYLGKIVRVQLTYQK